MKTATCVISRPENVRWDIMPTASVTSTGQQSTPLRHAETLTDTTPMAHVIIIPATASAAIIRSTANAIVDPTNGIPLQHV